MKQLPLLLLVFLANMLSAQDTRQIGPFNELVVTGKLDVTLVQGETEQVVIDTDRYEDDINLSLRGGRLKLSLVDGWVKGDRRLRVTVHYRDLSEIRVTAGAELESEAVIVADQLEIKAGSGAEVDLELEVHTLEAGAVEGAVLELSGSVKNQYASAATGGMYNATRLAADRTEVKANTGGEARVVAMEHLDAVANTGGHIHYSGNPSQKYTRTNLAGDITEH
ncbi:MAG: head GIN domain-containing protein [Bacteroidota bacterium]